MPIVDSNLFAKDLEKAPRHIAQRPGQYGAGSVSGETSLNHLFQNPLISGGAGIGALCALTAGRGSGLLASARLPIANAAKLRPAFYVAAFEALRQPYPARGAAA